MPRLRTAFLTSLLLLSVVSIAHAERAGGQTAPITLQVDAREAPRRVFHAQLDIPVAPGPLTLFYPKWITWLPIGPVNNLVNLKIVAAGKVLPWRRDDIDMYAFHVDVPSGVTAIEVYLDYVSPSKGQYGFDPVATDQLLILNWNLVTLYPAGKPTAELTYKPILLLPEGWKLGTALPIRSQSGGKVEFEPVSLDTLIDSPVIAGTHYRVVPLAAPGMPPEEMDVAADSETALAVPQTFVEGYLRLMQEAEALFGAHHFRSYHFLVVLSDHPAASTIEHQESSYHHFSERALIDVKMNRDDVGYSLPHELTHSWNGKYRRPRGIATPDFQQSMKTELVWVYEGLTNYLGEVLSARSGFWTPEEYRESVAMEIAEEQHRAGRTWRPLVDTAVSAPMLFELDEPEWASWRRASDFYLESTLIWLEADVIIRQRSSGRRSLDDFCHAFFGPPSGSPIVKSYTFNDLVAALNEVVPYDWRGFFQKRVYTIAPQVPLGGIEQGGWKLIYNAKPNYWRQDPLDGLRYSIGMRVQGGKDKEGAILDVVPGLSAAEAGIAPGMKLVAVNGQPWSPQILRDALNTPGTPQRLELLVENAGVRRTYNLKYAGGLRYPHLERDPSHPDLLGEITKPHALPSVPAH